MIKKIVKGHYQFISRRWKTVSADAKKFVVRLLMHDPQRRPSAAQALDDPWLTRSVFDYLGFAPEVDIMDKVQATIQTFAGYGKLKKLALMLIAYRSTSEEIGYLKKIFEMFGKSLLVQGRACVWFGGTLLGFLSQVYSDNTWSCCFR